MQLTLPLAKYSKPAQQVHFVEQVLDRIKSLPGIEAAGATTTLPFVGDYINSFTIDGPSSVGPGELASATYYAVTPDYFRTMGIPLIRGRYFNEQDVQTTMRVVVINETLARRYFLDDDPVGRQIRISDGAKIAREIIGVVGDVKQHGLESLTTAQLYEPYAQAPLGNFTLTMRTSSDPETLAPAIRNQVYAEDRDQAVATLKTLSQITSDSVASRRLTMSLLTVFAIIALSLAAVGLYGVLAYSVTQRVHEIGIRIALGAEPRDVLKLVMNQALVLSSVGGVVGLAGAFALTRLISNLLFGIGAGDPATYLAILAMLYAVVLLASYVPARRATKVDPVIALRYE
jgi:putative ABC transport system permease protein